MMKFMKEKPERGIIKVSDPQPCWHCGEPTRYADIDFEAYLCSEECQDAKTKEFFAALRGEVDEDDEEANM